MTSLERRIARLTSIEDIKQLKARYCAYCDDGYDPRGVGSLFVADAVWAGGERFGRYEGRAAIEGFFAGISGDIVFAAHLVLNPIITVEDDAANGKWWLLMPCTTNIDRQREARWLLGEYDDDYVKRDGLWLFKKLRLDVKFFAPHLKGWID